MKSARVLVKCRKRDIPVDQYTLTKVGDIFVRIRGVDSGASKVFFAEVVALHKECGSLT